MNPSIYHVLAVLFSRDLIRAVQNGRQRAEIASIAERVTYWSRKARRHES